MFGFLKNIFSTLSLVYHSSWGFIFDSVLPCIKFIEAFKLAIRLNKDEFAKFSFLDHLKDIMLFSDLMLTDFSDFFVSAVSSLFPDLKIAKPTEKSTVFENTLKAFLEYVKPMSMWQRDLIYLKLASLLLKSYADKQGHSMNDNDAISLVQISYANHKLHTNF